MSAGHDDRTVWWLNCSDEECGATMLIYPHTDNERDLPDEAEWEEHPDWIECPVCGNSMDWGGTDHPADLLKNYPRGTS